jgi:hypothetical protein
MNARTIAHNNVPMQDPISRNEVKITIVGNTVFCPMCEIWHENTTHCQRND